MTLSAAFRSFACLAGLALAGCGGGLETGDVSGTITLEGQPLPNVSVKFTPKASGIEAPGSSAITDASGKYTLALVSTGKSGAVIGKHTVTITQVVEEGAEDDDSNLLEEESPLPDHNLSFEVKAGGNTADFNLEAK